MHSHQLTRAVHVEVKETFDSTSKEQLAHLLRDHKKESVNERSEIWFRRKVDIWLGQVGMLYLAWLSGYATFPEKSPDLDEVRDILSRPELRDYYETYYPVAVPWLLRLRFQEKCGLLPETSKAGAGAFERFSILYERFFQSDRELQQLLNFLDGFWYGDAESRTDIGTVVDSFKIPERITRAFGKPRDQFTRLDRGIVGMVRFWIFSEALDELLQLCREIPLVRSAFWFFYAYWFHEYDANVAELSANAIDNAVDAIRDARHGKTEMNEMSDVTAERDKWKKVMKRLTSGEYARALVDEMNRQSNDDAQHWTKRFRKYTRSDVVGSDEDLVF
jgi:hypothetical protein